jgi:hypothetical protein
MSDTYTYVDQQGNPSGMVSEPSLQTIEPAATIPTSVKTTTETIDISDKTTDNDIRKDDAIRDLHYPLALGKTSTNLHYVKFNINLDEESKLIRKKTVAVEDGYVNNRDQMRANTQTTDAGAVGAMSTAVGAVFGATKGAQIAHARFKGNAAAQAAGVAIGAGIGGVIGQQIAEFGVSEFKLTKKLKRLKNTITLYTPASISAHYGIEWSHTDDPLISMAQEETYSKIKGALFKALTPGENMLENVKQIGKDVSRVIAASASDVISVLSRTARNNKKDVLFRQVSPREFSFDYQFAPRDAAEAKEVNDIIYNFKLFAHPELLTGYAQFLYIYPAEFDIEYGYYDDTGNTQRNKFINKISSCVLRSVSVSYAPNGPFQSLENGEPIITNLSLRFLEIESLHQDRIVAGY